MITKELYFSKEQMGINCFFEKPNTVVTTPNGNKLTADTEELAERIVCDLNEYGPEYMGSDSILPWQYTFVDNFSKMDRDKVAGIIADSFLHDPDWTLAVDNEGLRVIFGSEEVRMQEMRDWLSELDNKQLTAVCCIGNAYESINIAYIFAKYLIEYNSDVLSSKIEELGRLIEALTGEFFALDIISDFETFKLYYKTESNRKTIEKEVPWRDENGKLVCQEDKCGETCNPRCPIHLKTDADQKQIKGDIQVSIAYYKAALEVAGDFDEAWNNLANAYGQLDMHKEAYEAFKRAYEGSNGRRGNALYCMAVASKNIGLFDEALRYCDEYDAKFGEIDTKNLRQNIATLRK